MKRLLALTSLVAASGACADGRGAGVGKVPPAALASSGNVAEWEYEVTASEDATQLDVTATFARGATSEFSVSEQAEPFVKDLRVEQRGRWETVQPRGASWFLPGCARGCRIRYRFELRNAAENVSLDSIAKKLADGVFEAPAHAWLLHPLQAGKADRLRFRVTTTNGIQFVTGLVPNGSGVYEIRADEIGRVPYSLFGRWRSSLVRVGDASVKLAILPGRLRATDAEITQWIARSTNAVRDYFGTFPVDGPLYAVVPTWGESTGFGRASAGAGGASILLDLGRSAGEPSLLADWVAVHETIHLTFPSVARDHIWVEEGIATYLEPIVRRRAGLTTDQDVWHQFNAMMPHGLPRANDHGMDHTHTWGRVYWGGALFWLVADVEIRKATQNTRSLGDALRAILRAGGNNTNSWELERAWDEGDRATGTHVLRQWGGSMGSQPVTVDLKSLFGDLGVSEPGGQVVLDDKAPLAAVRRAITAP